MYNLDLGAFMHKHSTNGLPNVFNNYFVQHSDMHNYPTRRANDMNITKNKIKSFSDNAVQTSRPIPSNSCKSLKVASSLKAFPRNI